MPGGLSSTKQNGESNIDWIVRMIKEKHIDFIDYKEFEKTEFINYGSSGVITKSLWKATNMVIALKQIASHEVLTEPKHQELIKEIKTFHSIKIKSFVETGYKNVIECFGVSRLDEETFLLVLEHADNGCLRDYLNKHRDNLTWEQKVNIARQHTGNIVIKKDENFKDGIRVMIIDFGLSKVVTRHSISNQTIGGLVNFVDPYILEELNAQYGKKYICHRGFKIASTDISLTNQTD
ncbi:20819_t:CDS:2 [Gigaspora margarita]|uniref:20819_t:CDS:1 n=1 Tax=Gigaspora margarita TaxID=4874 RepID=A0ABM8W147_GIGMA|nr:20819_t:CDS:2 [Gigaspora margarita]